MTEIQMKMMKAVERAANYYIDSTEIDWEQRRYELARSAISGIVTTNLEEEYVAKMAVKYADAIIKELK